MQKMDFEIGNILYIVITLVAVIIGLLGKKKKPGAPGTGEGASETQPAFMENLERMLSGSQGNPEITDLQEFEEDLPPEDELEHGYAAEPIAETRQASTLMDDYERIMHGNDQEEEDIFATGALSTEEMDMIDHLEVVELDGDSGVNYFEVMDGFDARTAIVYSAIINRIDY
jgi:hypothetical protein